MKLWCRDQEWNLLAARIIGHPPVPFASPQSTRQTSLIPRDRGDSISRLFPRGLELTLSIRVHWRRRARASQKSDSWIFRWTSDRIACRIIDATASTSTLSLSEEGIVSEQNRCYSGVCYRVQAREAQFETLGSRDYDYWIPHDRFTCG